MSENYDLLVIGDNEAGHCAAAAAAKAGRRAGIIFTPRRKEAPAAVSVSAVPNFVWRRFDLQEYGLSFEPVSARVTVAKDDDGTRIVSTFKCARSSQRALEQAGIADGALWPALRQSLSHDRTLSLMSDVMSKAYTSGEGSFADFIGNNENIASAGQWLGSGKSLTEDFIDDATLVNHVLSHAYGSIGLSGDEPGSAMTLAEFFNEDHWPVRPRSQEFSLLSVMRKICEELGVDFYEARHVELLDEPGKRRTLALSGDKKVKSQYIMIASAHAAKLAGLSAGLSPLSVTDNATATVRLMVRDRLSPPGGDAQSIFQISEGFQELANARAAVVDGRLPDVLPVQFEFADDGAIVAQTSFCPSTFRDDDGRRGWTGQDRQVIAARMIERLASCIDGLAGNVVKTDVDIIGAGDPDRATTPVESGQILRLPGYDNSIGAAVTLVDRVFGNE